MPSLTNGWSPRVAGRTHGTAGGGTGRRRSWRQRVALYDEWDHMRKPYRKHWCQIRICNVRPSYDGFAQRTVLKHGGVPKHRCRTFDALRGGSGARDDKQPGPQ